MKKRILSLLLIACLLSSLLPQLASTASAATYSGTCGENLTWTLNIDSDVLTISGVGNMNDYNRGSPWYSYRSSIHTVKIDTGVTNIGNYALYNCDNLTSMTISDGVTSIGDGAFSNCDSLTNMTIPDSVTVICRYAFSDCTGLTSVTIGNSVTTIGLEAFSWCDSLTSVTIPNSVTTIGQEAFSWCDSLTSVFVLNPNCEIYASANTLGSSSKTIISGHAGSTAQTYASNYGYTFVPICQCEGSTGDYCLENMEVSCTQEGGLRYICVACGSTIMFTTEAPATGHSYDYAVLVQKATCTQN